MELWCVCPSVQHPSPVEVLAVLEPPFPWEREEYFQPTLEGDLLLQHDFEGEGLGERPATPEATPGDEEGRGSLELRSVATGGLRGSAKSIE